ncbi:hypothetical protein AAFC00_006258 [Neodothiora populina]|uniref:Ams2/SPT21 N-terminal domain-containing protein n=1 Tax=Neodothiora populina TaxID=2781224 RepID=A0ABR3P5Z8_9PEZI
MTSPASFTPDMESAQSPGSMFGDIPTRPMRVKILYTFDNENKTNCLARFPEVLHIPTVSIEETTQIGVIELRKCIQAIVSASPELLSRLNQGDFTIYAYDYSEYETPLVGQGMLSSALAAVSPTPNAPAHQSKTMITGRVCQNVMGLFSNGVKETLEVKLRLVPVPRPVQSEYVKSMEMYRGISPAMSAGFDPNAWSASFQASALSLGAPFEEVSTPTSVRNDALDANAFDAQSMMQYHQRPRQGSTASFQDQPSFSTQNQSYAGPISRVNSPALSQYGPQPTHARSLSRASVRSDRSARRRESFNENEQNQEEGPARKRVKVTQTEWRGKSAFGGNPSDLRVTASTAASIRIHKPVPTRPGMTSFNSLEPPPRAPTPVPQLNPNTNRQGSFLRRESTLARAQSYNSPYSQPVDMPTHSDAAMSSPEDNVRNGSPADMPSSPPMMPDPSSPGLPTMLSFPKPMMDSGYMSSAFDCHDDDEDREVDEEDLQMAQRYKSREPRPQMLYSDFIEQTPGPPDLLPQRMHVSQSRSAQDAAAELSRQKARNAVLPPSERRASIALPPKQKEKSQEKSSFEKPPLNRASTTLRSEAASPAPTDDGLLPKAPRSGSGAKRKKTIADKLVQAIAQGELPAYCGHCGSIETPTWRALFTKVIVGSPDQLGPELDGVTMGTEIIERDDQTGQIKKYRIIKSTRKGKDPMEVHGYDTLQVCNPCGLWFNKYKVMRPADKWNKKAGKGRRRKTETDPNGPSEPQSDFPQSDFPQSDFFCDPPSTTYTEAAPAEEPDINNRCDDLREVPEAPQPAIHKRANSEQPAQRSTQSENQWTHSNLDAALHRAIQSSPAGRSFLGTQESPIDLAAEDLTPKPTRRLLFPSPRNSKHKTLDDTALPGSKPPSGTIIEVANVEDPCLADKENMPPPAAGEDNDDLAHLFECSPGMFRSPGAARKSTPSKNLQKTPRVGPGSFDDLLKTPTPNRSSLKTLSSNARQAFTPRTCSNGNNVGAFLPTFTSAEKQSYGLSPRLPATPSRFANLSSPSRANKGEMTPFTRQLTQLLSENGGSGASPGRGIAFDFSDLGSFMSPGRGLDFDKMEFNMHDFDGMDFSMAVKHDDDGAGQAGGVSIAATIEGEQETSE